MKPIKTPTKITTVVSVSNPSVVVTPHTHARAGGYVIGADIHLYICSYMYIYMTTKKNFEWHFSGQLTFSKTRGRLLVKFIALSKSRTYLLHT